MMGIHEQLAAWVDKKRLTAYRISQMVAAETDCTTSQRRATEKRWERLINREKVQISKIEPDLKILKLKIVLVETD